jgi:hypothetical protein
LVLGRRWEGVGAVIVKTSTLHTNEIREELDYFEQVYKMPSMRLADAFKVDGRLVETPEFRRWNHLFTLWQLAAATGRPTATA